jgi:protein TonB
MNLFDEKRSDLRPQLIPEQQNHKTSILPSESNRPWDQRIFSHPILWFLGTILVSVLTYVGAHLFLKPFIVQMAGRIHAEETYGKHDTASARVIGFGLKVNQSGGTMEVSWDLASPLIKAAKSGKLVVTDGTLIRELALSRDQLQSDKISYTPLDKDVSFRLEVVDSESHTVAESVRVLRSSFLPNSLSSAEQVLNPQNPSGSKRAGAGVLSSSSSVVHGKTAPRESNSVPTFRPETTIVTVPIVPVQQSPTPVTVGHPSPATIHVDEQPVRGQESASVALPAPLLISPARSPLTLSLPQENIADLNARHETHKSVDLPAATSRPATSANANKSIIAPQVLFGPTPDISHGVHPVLSKDLLVTVLVKVDERGNVTSAKLPSSIGVPSYFANQALTAARQWRFSPGKLNGRPIPSEMMIKFYFKPIV